MFWLSTIPHPDKKNLQTVFTKSSMSFFSLIKISPLKFLFLIGIFSVVLQPSLAQSNIVFKNRIGYYNYVFPTKLKENKYYINFGGNQFHLNIHHNSKVLIDSTGKNLILFFYPKILNDNTLLRDINTDYFQLKIEVFHNSEFMVKLNYLKYLAKYSKRTEPSIFVDSNQSKYAFRFEILRSHKFPGALIAFTKDILIYPNNLPYCIEISFLYVTHEGEKHGAKPIVRLPQFEYQL